MKRGQVALEFIMTYGWALLVVLVAIGALAFFGVLNPSKYLPDKCIFTTGVTCRDFAFRSDGAGFNVSFRLANGLGEGIVILQDQMGAAWNSNAGTCAPDDDPAWTGNFVIPADESKGFSCVWASVSPGAGSAAKVSVDFNYTTTQGFYEKQATGDISGSVQ